MAANEMGSNVKAQSEGEFSMTSESNQQSPLKAAIAHDTLLWIGVIATLLLTEIWMHVFGHDLVSLWGLIPAGVLFGAAVMAYRHYRRVKHIAWIIITVTLGVIGVSVATEALGLKLLPNLDLTFVVDPGGLTTRLLGRVGPAHGLLAVGHLFADLSVVGIGIYQLVRSFLLRDTGVGLSGIASLSACCGSTAVLLAPVFAAALGAFGIHSGVSYLTVAILLAVALIAIAFVYVWTGGLRRRPVMVDALLSSAVATIARSGGLRRKQA